MSIAFPSLTPPCRLDSCIFLTLGLCGQPGVAEASSGDLSRNKVTRVKFFGHRVANLFGLLVPFGALQEQPVHIAAVFWLLVDLGVVEVEVFELKTELIDGDDVFPGVVL